MDVIPWWQRPRFVMAMALTEFLAGAAIMVGVAMATDEWLWLELVAAVLMITAVLLVLIVRGRSRTLRASVRCPTPRGGRASGERGRCGASGRS